MNPDALRTAINRAYLAEEKSLVQHLLSKLPNFQNYNTDAYAHQIISAVRNNKNQQSTTETFLREYQLNSNEGIVLMSIAEALLRIPDKATQDCFLADKLTSAYWHEHLHHSESLLVNLSIDLLQLTGQFEQYIKLSKQQRQLFNTVLARLGQPLIRNALKHAMRLLGSQFIIAETIAQAITESQHHTAYRYSFDMLGEAALTSTDADRYYQAYQEAINNLAMTAHADNIFASSSISIKLSALYPRYEPLQHNRAVPALKEKLFNLVHRAKDCNVMVTIDAEESERLDMSLDIFESISTHPDFSNWPGFGLAIQAYQKRASFVIHWLANLAENKQCQIPVRLVKGAYWDTEIKRAQQNGLDNYPVFTRKSATDISYLACAHALLNRPDIFYPQFATHNAHTVAVIYQMAGSRTDYEFQRLHGMGDALYRDIIEIQHWPISCRIYAPVGNYQELLPYLVRRLLENGANTSFVNQIENPDIPIENIIKDPIVSWKETEITTLPLPADIFIEKRLNSRGLNLADLQQLNQLQQQIKKLAADEYQAYPLINGQAITGPAQPVTSPFNNNKTLGTVISSDKNNITDTLNIAVNAFHDWRLHPVKNRAQYLNNAANLLEKNHLMLVTLCVHEGGRTIKDALFEVREAVDFCRYYAATAIDLFDQPTELKGPTGEENLLRYYGRGVFVCISPWNFPIAIFIGQITAALVAGNTVIAKPAEFTSLTAMACIRLLHQAGIPTNALQFLPGNGAFIGKQLLADERIAGVVFTGSTNTAQIINQQLADHQMIVPLIAETGGQNIMITDSSAHMQQLVQDVIHSAFNSAGQRCSALRVLFIPSEIADNVIELIISAMQELILGRPDDYATDIGPVISDIAVQQLTNHLSNMRQMAKILYQVEYDAHLCKGHFFSPTLIEIDDLKQLKEEVFGPILHVIRYSSNELDKVIEAVNATGYGLTLGIHSRINETIQYIQQHVKVGNLYINRDMIGAAVGVQPFGGMGLSGTGPKAGGPDYLRRFAVEQTVTTNTAAIGGNTSLLAQNLR